MTRITIVYMGDSITFGQFVDLQWKWTTLVTERLRKRFDGELVIEATNSGISGDTTRMGLERFPADVQQLLPDVMTLQFGLNDCNCWESDRGLARVSESAFDANLREMVARARHFGAREVIMQTSHRTLRRADQASGEPFEAANARYSEIIRQIGAELETDLCDIREVFEPFDDASLERMLLPAPDLLHLSPEGNRVYADTIYPHVEAAVERVAATKSNLEVHLV